MMMVKRTAIMPTTKTTPVTAPPTIDPSSKVLAWIICCDGSSGASHISCSKSGATAWSSNSGPIVVVGVSGCWSSNSMGLVVVGVATVGLVVSTGVVVVTEGLVVSTAVVATVDLVVSIGVVGGATVGLVVSSTVGVVATVVST